MLLAQKATENLTIKETGQHTLGHIHCPECAAARNRLLQQEYDFSAHTRFTDAAETWLQSLTFNGGTRHHYVSPRTLSDYRGWCDALVRFFGLLPLNHIHVGHIREYQKLRACGELAGPPRKGRPDHPEVGPNRINQELAILIRIMKRANCWMAELDDLYQPLITEQSDVPQALTPIEQERLLRTASSVEHWRVVYWYALLGFATTMSNYEMRGTRLGDITDRIIMVRADHAKRPGRIRTIPLTDDALWAVERLLDRARSHGARSPQHYLFPFRERATHLYDPSQPMTYWGIRKEWDEVRDAAGLPWFSMHDVRHTAITRLAEAGTPIPVIMSLAGHLSQRMMSHYTHISEQSKRLAVNAAQLRIVKRPEHPIASPVPAAPTDHNFPARSWN